MLLTFTSISKILRLAVLVVLPVSMLLLSCGKSSDEGDDVSHMNGIDKKWKLSMVKYEDLHQTDAAEKGFRAGLLEAGLEEGVDFEMHVSSAGGDLPTVLSLVDKVNTDGTDMLLSLQTATLETAIVRSEDLPIVFMVVANPFVIGSAGVNDSIKLPYVTGVYTMTTFERMMGYIKETMPNIRKLGTLYSTSELNATYYRYQLIEAAERVGVEVESFGVSSKADVGKSIQALLTKDVDAICQIEDNLTSATFPAITQVAEERNIPVFSFVKEQILEGSSIVFAPDYFEAAKTTASKAVRIMKGESPKSIHYERINRFYLLVNPAQAKESGITIPQNIIDIADEVVGQPIAKQ
jgi:putative tryptophan/tyrosine transport system substrate-binding protein